ncbi:MAG: hypothetical protein ABF586_07040 [Sporolactobacillus sp.]
MLNKKMMSRTSLILLLCVLMAVSVSKAAPIDRPITLFTTRPVPTGNLLIAQSDCIVAVHLDGHYMSWPTGKRLPSGARLVNSRQILHRLRVLKGSAPDALLTTGIRPLPEPHDPLNKLYTGPLADGDYLLFLNHYSRTDAQLNGGFSAVYPIYQGRTIALEEGFPSLGGKTLDEVAQLLQ